MATDPFIRTLGGKKRDNGYAFLNKLKFIRYLTLYLQIIYLKFTSLDFLRIIEKTIFFPTAWKNIYKYLFTCTYHNSIIISLLDLLWHIIDSANSDASRRIDTALYADALITAQERLINVNYMVFKARTKIKRAHFV